MPLVQRRSRVQKFVYRATLIVFIILFVASVSLLPIDTLIQTKKNDQSLPNITVNAFIVLTFCVIFIVASGLFAFVRFFKFYRSLNDIPKNYTPIHENDFNNKLCHQHIVNNFKRCQKIYHELTTPQHVIEHSGLSSPIKDETVLPRSLVYEDVIRSIGDRLKLSSTEQTVHLSFREIFSANQNNETVAVMIDMYEKLRFSNKAISQEEILEFLVEFLKAYR